MSDPDVLRAVAALRRGGLLVLPTETVYGLAADATDPEAVARIYAVKGRPSDHPLILHVAAATAMDPWVREVPDYARQLAHRGWPGPLTLVMRRSDLVGDHVTGGQDTVALRVPAHPLAHRILADFGGALAAPSANRFGHVSPTTVAHVEQDIGALLMPGLDVIIDGGACRVGVESTIVSCLGEAPVVLRPGSIGTDQITALAGVSVASQPAKVPQVSGSLISHYAPRATVVIADSAGTAQPGDGLLAGVTVATPVGVIRLLAAADDVDYARRLYSALRHADALHLARIVAVPPAGCDGAADAVCDRLQRAAAPRTAP